MVNQKILYKGIINVCGSNDLKNYSYFCIITEIVQSKGISVAIKNIKNQEQQKKNR